ncbi:MAG: glycosyltransferase family 4 protein [Candidatus Omnitrophica bacterium]|nr:glycosyltransferase family 4 protein [Candidatus Omnitrophota bacterium]
MQWTEKQHEFEGIEGLRFGQGRPSAALRGVRSVLHINDHGGQLGSTEQYIDSTSKALLSIGIESHLIYGQLCGKLGHTFRSTQCVGALSQNRDNAEAFKQISRAVRALAPDLVFVHNIFDIGILEALLSPGRKYSLLWFIHDHHLTCLSELRARLDTVNPECRTPLSEKCLSNLKLGYCIQKHKEREYLGEDLLSRLDLLRFAKRADALIVPSQFMRGLLIRNLSELKSKIHVLPHPVSRPVREILPSANRDYPSLLFNGRIAFEKGLHIALEALMRLEFSQELLFTIAGPVQDERYWAHCKKLIHKAKQLNPRLILHYVGNPDETQSEELYRKADIVLLPSLWSEPHGKVCAEALAHGAAIIASNVGDLATWIIPDKTGVLVRPKSSSTLARAIKQLLEDANLRRELVLFGRELIRVRFTETEHFWALDEIVRRSRRI